MIETKQLGSLEYLVCQDIPVPHCFTTRLGGISSGYLSSLNIGTSRGDDPNNVIENYRRLGDALGFDIHNLVLSRQTHSDIVRVVTGADCRGLCHRDYPECDGLVTAEPGLALLVFTADCTPVLLYDPVTGAVGACHAGWRGTARDIAGKTARAMAASFGCDPKNIRAAVGPNIGFCHFETGTDVPEAMIAAYGKAAEAYIRPAGEKYHVDLKAMNRLSLNRAGVEQVDVSEACTMCRPDLFFSHRTTGGNRGSQGAVIVCGKR